MKPIFITKTLAVAVDNNIAQSQSPAAFAILLNGVLCSGNTASGVCASQSPGAGAIVINGTQATGGVAMLTAARKLFLTSGGNDSAIIFSVIGRDAVGRIIGEAVTGTNTGTVNTRFSYRQVTTITHTGTVAGTLVVGTQGEALMDTQRQVRFTSGGNDTAINFTVTGTNDEGVAITETIAGSNASTADTTMSFYTVTGVTASGSVATTLKIGTNGVGHTKPIPLDQHTDPFAVALFIEIGAGKTVNCTVQYTPDDVYTLANVQSATGLLWTDHAGLSAKTASIDSNIAYPAAAVRFKINSGTDPATLIVRQAGIFG